MKIYIISTIILSSFLIFISYIISRFTWGGSWRFFDREKLTAVECGFNAFEEEPGKNNRENFYIKFYIVGIIFLIFDLESMLIYPYTILLSPLTTNIYILHSFLIFLIFMIVLVLGLIYELYKGIL